MVDSQPARLQENLESLQSMRENLRTKRRDPLDQVVNASVNQTLSRTIITAGTTFLAVLAFNPLRNRLQTLVDRIFDRDRAGYREAVRTISEAMVSMLSLAEIAAQADRPLGTVKTHLHRGLARLRRSLESEGGA